MKKEEEIAKIQKELENAYDGKEEFSNVIRKINSLEVPEVFKDNLSRLCNDIVMSEIEIIPEERERIKAELQRIKEDVAKYPDVKVLEGTLTSLRTKCKDEKSKQSLKALGDAYRRLRHETDKVLYPAQIKEELETVADNVLKEFIAVEDGESGGKINLIIQTLDKIIQRMKGEKFIMYDDSIKIRMGIEGRCDLKEAVEDSLEHLRKMGGEDIVKEYQRIDLDDFRDDIMSYRACIKKLNLLCGELEKRCA